MIRGNKQVTVYFEDQQMHGKFVAEDEEAIMVENAITGNDCVIFKSRISMIEVHKRQGTDHPFDDEEAGWA